MDVRLKDHVDGIITEAPVVSKAVNHVTERRYPGQTYLNWVKETRRDLALTVANVEEGLS